MGPSRRAVETKVKWTMPEPAMNHLDALPNELIIDIYGYIYSSMRDVTSLRATSKRLDYIALPMLAAKGPKKVVLAPYKETMNRFLAMSQSSLQSTCTTLCLELDPLGQLTLSNTDLFVECMRHFNRFTAIDAVLIDPKLTRESFGMLTIDFDDQNPNSWSKDLLKIFCKAIETGFSHGPFVPKLIMVFPGSIPVPCDVRNSIAGVIPCIEDLEIREQVHEVYDERYPPDGQPWKAFLSTGPAVEHLKFTESTGRRKRYSYWHEEVSDFADMVFPPGKGTHIGPYPYWSSLRELTLLNVALDRDNLERFCRVKGYQISKLTTGHPAVSDRWGERFDDSVFTHDPFAQGGCYDFLRPLPALRELRLEFCKSFASSPWPYYHRAKNWKTMGAHTCVCSRDDCQSITCFDLGEYYLTVESKKQRR